MDKHKISISFKEEYSDIYNYLKSKDNISAYICKLVKADIKATAPANWEEQVTKLITQVLENGNFSIATPVVLEDNNLTAEEQSLIANLF